MKSNLPHNIVLLQKTVKAAYEEAVKENYSKVKDLLLDCLVMFSKIDSEPSAAKTKKHKWSVDDEIVGFYLASRYEDTSSFRRDPIAKRLVQIRRTISFGSLQMLIQNFYYLMRKDKGLKSASKLAKDVHAKFKGYPLSELEKYAKKSLEKLQKN